MANDESLLLDTHVWFRSQVLPGTIKPSTIRKIDEAAGKNAVYISVISIWELAMLERAKRIELDGGVDRWCREALEKPGIWLLPFSPRIAVASVYLPRPMHKDPSDRILVASALVEGLTLVTLDKEILASAQSLQLNCLRA